MIKEEFCKYVPIAYHDTYLGDCMRVENVIAALNEHFVCIPRSENRHLYADVWHEWAEDTTKEIQLLGNDGLWYSPSTALNLQARIKPSEPVYEWQWCLTAPSCGCSYTKYLTDEEAEHYDMDYYKCMDKIEDTKRIRK